MGIYYRILYVTFFLVSFVFAQNQDFFDANSTAPGFSLLDKAPESINRPQDVKALSIALTNAFTENNGLPTNFAIELTPYWFVKNKKKTLALI